MNTSQIKSYAPKARRDFIQAVTARANMLGLSDGKIIPVEIKGDVAIIEGRAYPKVIANSRQKIIERINSEGFNNVIERTAYIWFNRIVALRYMELHDYIDHGYRVLSNRSESGVPEILEKATEIELPGLNKDKVIELRLAGDKDNELYRMLLVAQCNALHKAMPFLFEHIYDGTELLLPDNLLFSDSPIRRLVNDIDEELWSEVEIIGWLYQFYISEKKDQVIGKVVKSEDIPAATQLFTPNWIVKYMVQNTLGRMWMATYPDSSLKEKMDYYIEPAEQESDVQKQVDEITPKELNPEDLTFLDPACGSGHILVEAYDLFKEIYLERGYRTRDIPVLIMQKNLYGIDIDDRAAQLAGFALLMKARQDDRGIFTRDDIELNVISIKSSDEIESNNLINIELEKDGINSAGISELIELFKNAETFGSLITVPETMVGKLEENKALIEKVITAKTMYKEIGGFLLDIVRQAVVLSNKYDCVVTNPPYMGLKAMNAELKSFANKNFPDSKSDLFAMFIEKCQSFSKSNQYFGLITMQSWMFLSSYEKLREKILTNLSITTMAHLGARAFGSISGEVVQTTTFVLINKYFDNYKPTFFRLIEGGERAKKESFLKRENKFNQIKQNNFKKIPGSPIGYWATPGVLGAFDGLKLSDIAEIKGGMSTSDNGRFLRFWHEVSLESLGTGLGRDEATHSSFKWFPYNKGGKFRRWYGNRDHVVNWQSDGLEIKQTVVNNPSDPNTTHWSRRIFNTDCFFKPSLTWGDISSSTFSSRRNPAGSISDGVGISAYGIESKAKEDCVLGLLNSCVLQVFTDLLCPTLHFNSGPMGKIPVLDIENEGEFTDTLVHLARFDWDGYERSWDFQSLPILTASSAPTPTLESSYTAWIIQNRDTIAEMKHLEKENNRLFIAAYGLADELTFEVPIEQITLTVNPAY